MFHEHVEGESADNEITRYSARVCECLFQLSSVSYLFSSGPFVIVIITSNYDAFGNPRFLDELTPYGYPRMKSGVYNEALNWGFTSYDNVGLAFITTFQVITLEGWTDIMTRVSDVWLMVPTIVVFILLVVLGGVIVLNIVLAVISGSLDKLEMEAAKQQEEVVASSIGIGIMEAASTPPPTRDSFLRRKTQEIKKMFPKDSALQRKMKVLVMSRLYTRFILAMILLNVSTSAT